MAVDQKVKPKKKSQKQIFEELFALIETGVKEKIEEAFATAEELNFDLMKKLSPWEKVVGEITIDNLANFFSIKKLELNIEDKEEKAVLKNIIRYTQLEELVITGKAPEFSAPVLPKNMSALRNLRVLKIDHIRGDSLPLGLTEMGNLKEVFFYDIGIDYYQNSPASEQKKADEVRESLLQLKTLRDRAILQPTLKQLYIKFNPQNHQFLDILESITHLTELEILWFNGLSHIDHHKKELYSCPKEIGNLINLKELKLFANNFTTIPQSFSKLINLESLSFYRNALTSVPEFIGTLPNLKELNIKNNCFGQTVKKEDFPFLANTKIKVLGSSQRKPKDEQLKSAPSSLKSQEVPLKELSEDTPKTFRKNLLFSDYYSKKFWNIYVQGNQYTTEYGERGGANPRSTTKVCKDEEATLKAAQRKFNEKINKGYYQIGGDYSFSTKAEDLLKRFKDLVTELEAHPSIEVNGVSFKEGATDEEIAKAKEQALNLMDIPADMEAFYRLVNGITIQWSCTKEFTFDNYSEDGTTIYGSIELMPIQNIFRSWEGSLWWGDDDECNSCDGYNSKYLYPLNFMQPEYCAAFYCDGIRNPEVAFHYCGEQTELLHLDFFQYLDAILQTKGCSAFHWAKMYEIRGGREYVIEPELFRIAMPEIFPDFNFQPLFRYQSMNIWDRVKGKVSKKFPLYTKSLQRGTTVNVLAKLEKKIGATLPRIYKEMYLDNNGELPFTKNPAEGYFFGLCFLSQKEVTQTLKTWESIASGDTAALDAPCSSKEGGKVKAQYANPKWLPLLHDGSGNYVGLDFDPGESGTVGQIINFGRDEECKYVFANSLGEFLGNIQRYLGSPHIVVDEDGRYNYKGKHFIDALKKLAGPPTIKI